MILDSPGEEWILPPGILMEEDMASQVQAYMPLYVSDFVVSTQSLTQSQLGAYIRLLCFAWSEGGLPNDYEACSRIAGGIPKEDWAVIRKRLQVFDAGTSEERLSHPRMEKVRVKACRAYESRVAGAEKARRKREDSDHQVDHQVDHQSHAPDADDSLQLKPKLKPKPKLKLNSLEGSKETPIGVSTAKRHKAARRCDPLAWSPESGWTGITDKDREEWGIAYPAVDLTQEMAASSSWLRANPKRAVNRVWRRFLHEWLARVQGRGGTRRQAVTSERRNCL